MRNSMGKHIAVTNLFSVKGAGSKPTGCSTLHESKSLDIIQASLECHGTAFGTGLGRFWPSRGCCAAAARLRRSPQALHSVRSPMVRHSGVRVAAHSSHT